MYAPGHFLYFPDGRFVSTVGLVVPRGGAVLGGLPLATGKMTRKKTHPSRGRPVRKGNQGGVSFSPSHFFISRNVLQLE